MESEQRVVVQDLPETSESMTPNNPLQPTAYSALRAAHAAAELHRWPQFVAPLRFEALGCMICIECIYWRCGEHI